MLKFRDFLEAEEYQWGFFGDIKATLGFNLSERLNYGTATAFGGSPMLYVPLIRGEGPLSQTLASVRRMLTRTGMQCTLDSSAFNGYRCQPDPQGHKANVMHTGEAHVTVAMGKELPTNALSIIQEAKLDNGQPLFNKGVGIEMPVHPIGKLVYGIALAFKGKPLVALMQVQCPKVLEVRKALGLSPQRSGYVFHVTVGYAFGNWTDQGVTTKNAPRVASGLHNRGYLNQFPEWFKYLGEIDAA